MARTLRRWASPVFLIGLAALFLPGCQQEEEIRRYSVPRAPTYPAPAPKVRMLAAIFPQDDRTWFFKLTGPTAVVNQNAEAFDRFIQSLRFTGKEDSPVEWAVPEGWQKMPTRPGGFVRDTFRMGPAEEPAELTVSTAGGALLENVNRWRGQLGLKDIGPDGLAKVTQPLEVNGVKGTRVDLSGPGGRKPRMGMGR